MITVPSQQFTIPVKVVKNMHEAFSNYNALEPYDVEICRYKKGFGVVIYQLNYCILKNGSRKGKFNYLVVLLILIIYIING